MNNKWTIHEIVLNGMFIALVFIATYFIKFQLPISATGGLVHTGNIALFTIAAVFGARRGAIAGAFGMGLFDVLSGWMIWAPGTFVIRGVMGYMIGYIFEEARKRDLSFIATSAITILLSSVWMITGYYVVESLLYSNWIAPLNSIPGDITQIVIGWVVGLPLIVALRQVPVFKRVLHHE